MEEKCNAIVIRATNYRENDKMITLFSLENGLVSACLRGVKKTNAKLKFAGELFCFGEFLLAEKNGRRTVTEVNQIDSFYNVRLDPYKLSAASAMCEFVSGFMLSGMKSYELFLNLVNGLKVLSASTTDPKKVLIAFYLDSLRLAGYEMEFGACSRCGGEIEKRVFFSFGEWNCVCTDCATRLDTEIRFSTYEVLKKISTVKSDVSSDLLNGFDFSEDSLVYALKFLDFFMEQNAGVTIKSHGFLMEKPT